MDEANVKLLDATSLQVERGISAKALSSKDSWVSDDSSHHSSTCSQSDDDDDDDDDSDRTPRRRRKSLFHRICERIPSPRMLFKIFLVVGLIVTIAVLFMKFKARLIELPYNWAQSKGFLGGVYVGAFLVVWVMCGFPVTFMELLCGFMFGYGYGLLVGFVGKQIGAMAGFMLGRKLLMKRSANLRERYIMLQAIDLSLKESPHKMIWLIAVAYVPEAIKIYGLSIFECVGFWYFSLVIGVTGIPYSLVTTWIGSSSQDLLQVINNDGGDSESGAGVSAGSLALLIVGVVCAIVLLIMFCYYGMKARRRILARLQNEENVTGQIEKDLESGHDRPSMSAHKSTRAVKSDGKHGDLAVNGECSVSTSYSSSILTTSEDEPCSSYSASDNKMFHVRAESIHNAEEKIPDQSTSSNSLMPTTTGVAPSITPVTISMPREVRDNSLIEMPISPRTERSLAPMAAAAAAESTVKFHSAVI